jgi:hypothetical protein
MAWSAETAPEEGPGRSGAHELIGFDLGPLYKGDHDVMDARPDLDWDV